MVSIGIIKSITLNKLYSTTEGTYFKVSFTRPVNFDPIVNRPIFILFCKRKFIVLINLREQCFFLTLYTQILLTFFLLCESISLCCISKLSSHIRSVFSYHLEIPSLPVCLPLILYTFSGLDHHYF